MQRFHESDGRGAVPDSKPSHERMHPASRETRPVVAVVGDFDPKNHTHQATIAGLSHAEVGFEWVSTTEIDPCLAASRLGGYGGVFIAPSSPYRSMEGALAAIRYARERGVPFVAT